MKSPNTIASSLTDIFKKLRKMNSRQLEIFCAIMVHGTMTEAAEVLHISQPALSQALGQLEGQIGYKLFGRSKGRLVPSPEAHILFSDAKNLLGGLKNLERQAKSLQHLKDLTRIASSYAPALSLIPIAVEAFRRKHPMANVSVDIAPAQLVIRKLQNSEADVGVMMRSDPFPLLDIEVFAQTQLVCVMKESDPLAQLDRVTAKDLKGRQIITYPSDTNVGDLVDKALLHTIENIEISMIIQTAFTALGFVLFGNDIAVVEALAAPWANTNGLTTRPLHPLVPVPISLATRTSTPSFSTRQEIMKSIRGVIDHELFAASNIPFVGFPGKAR